ncbi:hypothetical protein GSY74_00295 [Sulfurovum sp. bin170]|nr:hypothetical protein [Sulfurovum sp. bin170]
MSKSGSAYIFKTTNNGDSWTEVQKIVASDRAKDDYFGLSVAISGDYAIVGAICEDENASGNNNMINSGSAYIFKTANNGDSWTEVQKIVASDRAMYDNFGNSVAISGDYAIVGTPEPNTYTGSAYIFKFSLKPTLSSLSPTDNATGVSRTANLVITLSEDIVKGTGDIVIKKTTGDVIVETINVTGGLVTISGAEVTINPNTELDYATEYYVQIPDTALKNSKDDYFYAGITDKTSWSFTTVANQIPTITGTTANQAVDDNATIKPFSTIVLKDVDNDDINLTISLDDNEKGTLSSYTIARGGLLTVQTALQNIVFTPSNDRVSGGDSETTTFTISINDSYVTIVDNNTTVISTNIATPILSNITISQGNADYTSKVSYTPTAGNSLVYHLVNSSINVPGLNGTLPDGTTPYTSGADIPNAEVGQYLVVYEVDSSGEIVGFYQQQLSVYNIKPKTPVTITDGNVTTTDGKFKEDVVAGTKPIVYSATPEEYKEIMVNRATYAIFSDGNHDGKLSIMKKVGDAWEYVQEAYSTNAVTKIAVRKKGRSGMSVNYIDGTMPTTSIFSKGDL